MQLFKKFFFAFPFLIFFLLMIFSFKFFIGNFYEIFFSFGLQSLVAFIGLIVLIILSSYFYVVFVVLSQKWEYVIPVIVIASLIPIFLIPINLGIIFMFGFLIILSIVYFLVVYKLKNYINFDPSLLFTPIIKRLNLFIVLVITVIIFFSLNADIKTKGFNLPDSIYDFALKLSMSGIQEQTSVLNSSSLGGQVSGLLQNFSISKEQIDLLKKNPQLLKQYGIDPSILDDPSILQATQIGSSQSTSIGTPESNNGFMKAVLKSQFQKMIQPYLMFIPLFITMLFFFSLTFFLSIFSIFISPSLILMFKLLKQSGFVKFEKVMVEAEKLVI